MLEKVMVTNTEVGDLVIKSPTYDNPVQRGGRLVYRVQTNKTKNGIKGASRL